MTKAVTFSTTHLTNTNFVTALKAGRSIDFAVIAHR